MRVGECLEFGWETFKRHASALVVIALALLVTSAVTQWVLSRALHHFAPMISMLIGGLLQGGMMAAARKAARGETPTVSDAFLPFTERQGDYVIVGLASNIGVLLCGVGWFVTAFLCLLAPLLVVDGADFKQALGRSKDLMLKSPSESVTFFVALLLLNAVGVLALGVGLLVTGPISALAIVRAFEQSSAAPLFPPDSPVSPV